jgi:glycerol kinase
MLDLFNIPKSMLPEIVPNCGDFGETDLILPGHTLPICGMAGDQQAALIGQACFREGMVKATYGTGCFALMNTGTTRPTSTNRLLATCAYDLGEGGGGRHYALEGAIFVAGAAIQWLRDQMKFFANAAESEALAKSANQETNVMFVPAFTGLGAPYWDPHARAALFGLTREAGQAEITLAALEAQGFQSRDLKTAMEADTGLSSALWRVDGGLVANGLMCQRLADITGTTIEVTSVPESTALGAAFLAGLHTGVFQSLTDIENVWQASNSYKSQPMSDSLQRKTERWAKAVSAVQTVA